MECNGTTHVGTLEDDLGEIRFVYGDACHTITVDAWDGRRKRRNWGITYLDPMIFERDPRGPTGRLTRTRRRLSPVGA